MRESVSSPPDACGSANQPETAWWTIAFSKPLRNPENLREGGIPGGILGRACNKQKMLLLFRLLTDCMQPLGRVRVSSFWQA